LSPNCPLENRALSLSLCNLILKWEQRHQNDPSNMTRHDADEKVGSKSCPGKGITPADSDHYSPSPKRMKVCCDTATGETGVPAKKHDLIHNMVRSNRAFVAAVHLTSLSD